MSYNQRSIISNRSIFQYNLAIIVFNSTTYIIARNILTNHKSYLFAKPNQDFLQINDTDIFLANTNVLTFINYAEPLSRHVMGNCIGD